MQFELPGTLGVPDGSYLARDAAGAQSVLIVEALQAPSPPQRRRRQPAEAGPAAEPPPLPLTRATAVRAFEPFDSSTEAAQWLEGAVAGEEELEATLAAGVGLLNRALHACGVVSADPRPREIWLEQAVLVRVGYGTGEELSAGRFSVAREVDLAAGAAGRRRQRQEELRPQERLAAVLGGRERLDACESLLLRARADLDANRLREAALQLRIGLEAMRGELAGSLVDPRHGEDMALLDKRRPEVLAAAGAALQGDPAPEQAEAIRELLEVAERVLRRRRVLRG